MPKLVARQPRADYAAAVGRFDEIARLQARAQSRKSMLIFGPAGVGKTRLLQEFARAQPLALYVKETGSPRELLLALLSAINALPRRDLRLPKDLRALSTSSLKGVVQRTLDNLPYLMVLDHLSGPSRVLTRMIKELNYYDRTPVYFAARTLHMEDIGTLQPLCADRSEQIELRNLPLPIALQFAYKEAENILLLASNLDEAIHSIVDWSEGNPGGILQMLKMAHLPKYRLDDQIKAHVLYLDYRMGRTANGASPPMKFAGSKTLAI